MMANTALRAQDALAALGLGRAEDALAALGLGRGKRALAALVLGMAVSVGPAVAQSASLDAFRACAGLGAADARLACFDKAAESFRLAGPARDAAAPAPAASTFGRPVARPVEPDRIDVSIARIERRGNGKLRFVTETGESWAQTDTAVVRNLGEGPWAAEIRKASLGSFLLSLDGQAAVRVRRDQ